MAVKDLDLMTPHEVAAELRITTKSLANMRFAGRGPVYLKAGHVVRYRRADVLAWLLAETERHAG